MLLSNCFERTKSKQQLIKIVIKLHAGLGTKKKHLNRKTDISVNDRRPLFNDLHVVNNKRVQHAPVQLSQNKNAQKLLSLDRAK